MTHRPTGWATSSGSRSVPTIARCSVGLIDDPSWHDRPLSSVGATSNGDLYSWRPCRADAAGPCPPARPTGKGRTAPASWITPWPHFDTVLTRDWPMYRHRRPVVLSKCDRCMEAADPALTARLLGVTKATLLPGAAPRYRRDAVGRACGIVRLGPRGRLASVRSHRRYRRAGRPLVVGRRRVAPGPPLRDRRRWSPFRFDCSRGRTGRMERDRRPCFGVGWLRG